MLGTDTFKNGEVQFRPGPVYECATRGGFGVFDEINMARNEAMAVLHSLLDYRRRIDIPGYRMIEVDPACRFIATMNYGYSGTREMNEALMSVLRSSSCRPSRKSRWPVSYGQNSRP